MKEYTAHVSFAISSKAQNRTAARINILNKLQFPGNVIANLIVTIKDDEPEEDIDDHEVCDKCWNKVYEICMCKPVIKDLPDDE
tara:strand:+ start:441 stop:692 length:252 start_codon:yes stop_codon:yes gene_type:complete